MEAHTELLSEVFKLLSALDSDGDGNTVSQDELIAAHRGDFKLFEKMDTDSDDAVTSDEFQKCLADTYATKKPGRADKWLLSLLHTLKKGVEVEPEKTMLRLEALKKKRADEEAAWQKKMNEAKKVFKMIAELEESPETITREALVAAQLGDFKTFDKMNSNDDQEISEEEWLQWLTTSYKAKARTGDQWWNSFLGTFRKNLEDPKSRAQIDQAMALAAKQKEAKAAAWAKKIEDAQNVFAMIAELDGKTGDSICKIEIEAAFMGKHGGNFFDKMDADIDGLVTATFPLSPLFQTLSSQ